MRECCPQAENCLVDRCAPQPPAQDQDFHLRFCRASLELRVEVRSMLTLISLMGNSSPCDTPLVGPRLRWQTRRQTQGPAWHILDSWGGDKSYYSYSRAPLHS